MYDIDSTCILALGKISKWFVTELAEKEQHGWVKKKKKKFESRQEKATKRNIFLAGE